MKFLLKFLSLLFCANLCLSELFCPKEKELPEEIKTDSSYTINTINPVKYSGGDYKAIQIANKIFLNKSDGKFTWSSSALHPDSQFCPVDFVIPKKEDYESIIKQLGADAYSKFTEPNGFNIQAGKYYLTNTRGKETLSFNKMFMYLDGTNFKFIEFDPYVENGVCRCMLDLLRINLVFPDILLKLES